MTETTMHAAITTPASRIPLSCRTFFLMILGGCIIAALIVAYSLLLDRSGRAAENNEDVLQSAQHFRRKDLDVAAPRYTPTSLGRLVKLKHAAENIQQANTSHGNN